MTDHLGRFPSATAVAVAIRARIRDELQLTASAGVAPNKFLAKIASDVNKPDGLCVVKPKDIDAFLLPLPVARLPGVGKVMNDRLAALGVRTVAELRRLDAGALDARFGRWGRRLSALAHGIDDHPVNPDRPRRSISAEDTFAEDLPQHQLAPHIQRMAEKTWAAAETHGWRGRTVVLKLKTADFRILTRSITPASPPTCADDLRRLALGLLARVGPPADTRYRLVGVGLEGRLAPAEAAPGRQASLFLAAAE